MITSFDEVPFLDIYILNAFSVALIYYLFFLQSVVSFFTFLY